MNNQFTLHQFDLIKNLIDTKVEQFNSEIDKQEILDSFKPIDIDKLIQEIDNVYNGQYNSNDYW